MHLIGISKGEEGDSRRWNIEDRKAKNITRTNRKKQTTEPKISRTSRRILETSSLSAQTTRNWRWGENFDNIRDKRKKM